MSESPTEVPPPAADSQPQSPAFSEAVRTTGFMNKFWALLDWYYGTRLGRMLQRYSIAKGSVLAGGITYMSMFSLASALTIGLTIFRMIIGNNVVLRDSVFSAIDKALPGVLRWKGSSGIVSPDQLVINTGFSLAGIIAIVVLAFSATYMMSALKVSIRQMFGIAMLSTRYIYDLLRDVLGFIVMALGLLGSAVAGLVTSTVGGRILTWLGLNSKFSQTLLSVGVLLSAALIDGLVLLLLIRFVAGVRVPWPDLWRGLLIGIIAAAVLRYLGTRVIGSVRSPLLAGFTALVTILIWVYLLSRLVLYISAYMANPPRAPQPTKLSELHARETPNYVTLSVPATLEWAHEPLTGTVQPVMPTVRQPQRALASAEAASAQVKLRSPLKRLHARRLKQTRAAATGKTTDSPAASDSADPGDLGQSQTAKKTAAKPAAGKE